VVFRVFIRGCLESVEWCFRECLEVMNRNCVIWISYVSIE